MRPLFVFFGYLALTLVMTWPLAAGIASDVPGDLGDSLLNMWILGWGAEMFPRLLTGEVSLPDVWNANIFHPEPLALGFSEHLFGQVLQILPVYHLTGNLILCYNLLFISSFALSAFGMYLLVRDITGSELAAVLAGLVYGFTPVRTAHIAQIQIVSSQWMPFALYGFHRCIRLFPRDVARDSLRASIFALAGGAAALVMQNWSCGYYLLFFTPFAPLFVIHQLARTGKWRQWQLWVAFAAAALIVFVATWPFLALYIETQHVHAFERPFTEITAFAADVYGYLTAPEALTFLGRLRLFYKPEGEVFLGFVPVAIGLVGGVLLLRALWRETAHLKATDKPRRLIASALSLVMVAMLGGLIAVLFTAGAVADLGGLVIRASNANRLLVQLLMVSAALVALSPRARNIAGSLLASPMIFALAATLLAIWLSLGPVPRSMGQSLQLAAPYLLLYEFVPGFDGLRAVARYAMVAALFLAMFAGTAAAMVRGPRAAPVILLACVLFAVEAAFFPLPVNLTPLTDGAVRPRAQAPAVYHRIAQLSDEAVITEFPFGPTDWEVRAVYYSTVHWKRIVNGYSGGFPRGYVKRLAVLQRVEQMPDLAWSVLLDTRTTHVVVHEGAYSTAQAEWLRQWLVTHGAREIGRFNTDVLYEVPGLMPGPTGN